MPEAAPRPRFLAVAAACLVRGFREASRHRAATALSLAGMLGGLCSFFFLDRFIGRTGGAAPGAWFAFALVGFVGLDLFGTALGACGRRVRLAQLTGTLDAMLATPAPEGWVVLLLPAWDLCAALLRAVAYVAVGALGFGVALDVNAASLLLALPIVVAAFVPLGLLGAAVTMTLRRSDPIALLFGMIGSVFGGALYPIDVLPEWGRRVAQAVPLTHALDALRGALLHGAPPSAILGPLVALAASAAVLALACGGAFAWALRRARVDGSLTQY